MAKYRILIVDDDDDARRLLAIALSERYETVEACDGLDALSKLEIYEPDFAIIDIMMPLMDGYQLCESIRSHPSFKHMQVIFLSAFGTNENVKKSYAVGANLFMTKPVDPDRVLKNIDFTIEHEPPPMRNKRYSLHELERVVAKQQAAEEARNAAPPEPPPPPPPKPEPEPEPMDKVEEPVQAEDQQTASEPARAVGALPRILVVDDDPEMLEMINLVLREDFEVTTAGNGLEAIEFMVDYEPDIMLLDIMMPKMNGYQLLQSIRRNAFFKTLPVVVLSAKSTPKDREYAARLGATNFIPKPYQVDELMETLLEITRLPDFLIRPKKTGILEIREMVYLDHSNRVKKEQARQKREKYTEMEKVIREGKKET
jgi:twitching motility two-component system response regulator PilH